MNFDVSYICNEYLFFQQDVFTLDEFYHYVRSHGVKINKVQCRDLLNNSDYVFALVNNEYVTRAGVFIGRWFSFMPSKEEVQKKHILIGHRCMPFINPDVAPDSINVVTKTERIESESTVFSMNLALDVFALYGEGYVLPYILNDRANKKVPLSSVQYSLPVEVELTSWPLDKISPDYKFRYGDRILARVVNWEENVVEFSVLKADRNTSAVSEQELEREEWYTYFENGFLTNIEKNGPSESIEQQLAYLFLENQEQLCVRNCGSVEEFLKHTKKIGFAPYGVESRIWKTGENVPYIGSWNNEFSTDVVFSDMSMIFTPQVIDAYIKNFISEANKKKKKKESADFNLLVNQIFPTTLRITGPERKMLLLNIEKRHGIIEKEFNEFFEHKIIPVRKRIVELFTQVSSLLCSIGCSGLKMEVFPQQELVILVQLFSHLIKIIEEMENDYLRDSFPVDDINLSINGMDETFYEVAPLLQSSLDENMYKNIKIVE
ncbi:MAG: hypothetical protein K6A43_05450 [Treponema sp.]|nr:hypothetical protein [Treponema sp.]